MTKEVKDEDLEIRWPQDGDRIFAEAESPADVQVTNDPAQRFYRMPMGYKRAGDILVDRAKVDLADRPNIIYPALFCYRQSIELFLKRIVDEFGDVPSEKTHKLDALWKRFMQVVAARGGADSVGLHTVEKLVREMNEVDENSDAFRFPTDGERAPFSLGAGGIDLTALREAMHALENFFECCYLAYQHEDGLMSTE
jgi:HEPN domain-containing protein